jgi:hypothetical protein
MHLPTFFIPVLASPHMGQLLRVFGRALEFLESKVQNCRAFSRLFSRVFLNNGLEKQQMYNELNGKKVSFPQL